MKSSALRSFSLHLQGFPKNARDEWRFRFEKRPYSEIDARIAPLVKVLNETGVISTYASCQGHALNWGAPYIAFKSNTECAAAMELALRDYQISPNSNLNNHWTIHGSFNVEGDLVFRLWTPWLSYSSFTFLDWFKIGVFRSTLDRDFEVIASLVADLFSNDCKEVITKVRKVET